MTCVDPLCLSRYAQRIMRNLAQRVFAVLVCCGLIGSTAFAADGLRVSGVVRDKLGAVVGGAEVVLLTAQQSVQSSTRSDRTGRFAIDGVPAGTYVLRVAMRGFAEQRVAVNVSAAPVALNVVLAIQPVRESVTITANPGRVADADLVTQQVNVISSADLDQRAKAVTAQLANEEPGVNLQRTSPTVGGVFVRGLTGNKVSVFVDGVRYSNSAARGGINTFLDLIDASSLDAVEILRGPNSAEYGSDALGGSLQFISQMPAYGQDGFVSRTTLSFSANTADNSAGSSAMWSLAGRRFGLLMNGSARRVNPLRPGGGVDSHSAFTRFFGLPSSDFLGSRLPDTAFTQYAGTVRVSWSPAPDSQVIAHYSRGQQDGGRRYDQLLGGDGNLIADLRNLMLDFGYVRFDRQRAGWFDAASVTYSYNAQREERVNQGGNGNPRAVVTHEYERTRVHGVQGYVDKRLRKHELHLGAEFYAEGIHSPSYGFNPVTLVSTLRRPRVPDGASYRQGGVYAEDNVEIIPQKLLLTGSVRYSAAAYRARAADSPLVNGQPLWPDDALRASDVTFRTGAVVTPAEGLSFSANVSRGFRAPHMTDLGTLGLTGSGFEVAAPDVAGMGAMVGNSAGADALSTGRAVAQLRPETSLTYEAGARYRQRVLETALSFFVNNIHDNITKQALILPPGAVGLSLGGQLITAQSPTGAVFVAASTNPVLVRANYDNARLYGLENRTEVRIGSAWSVGGVFTYVHARDTRTGLPPNIEGGTPAPDGYLKIRYAPARGGWWVEPYVHAAARQSRLSSLDLEDRRTGAMRSRSSIRNVLLNGATARGFVAAGPDGVPGTADDILGATGETLAQIQDRVLGAGVNSAALFTAVPGYVTFNLRGGFRVGERHRVMADLENIGDRNYRGISWGMDAPGRSLALRYTVAF